MSQKISRFTQKVLEEADKAYHNGDSRIQYEVKDRGDGLADFIRQELIELTEDADTLNQAAYMALSALQTARYELRVIEARLYAMVREEEDRAARVAKVPRV